MAELTPEEIKREQERLDLLRKQNEAAKELADTYKKIEKSGISLSDTDKKILDLTKELASFSSTIEKSIQKRISGSSTSKDISKSIKELEYDKLQNERKFSDISRQIDTSRAKALSESLRLHRQERAQIQSKLDLEGDTEDLYEQRKAAYQAGNTNLAKALTQQIKANEYNISLKEKEIQKTVAAKESQKDLVKQLIATKKAHADVIRDQEKELELAKEALKTKQKEEVLDAIKEKFRIKELKDMFTLAGLFKIILDAALRFQATSVNISKNLGYGADNADRVTYNLKDIAQSSNNVNVTLKNLGEAMNQLNEATGGVAEYSADALKTQVMLTKQLGLSGEEAAGIYKLSVLTGKSSSQVNREMAAAFANTRNSVKGSANFKMTMAEAAKVSGQLAANLRNNPALITKAIVQAQALGTTLEQTKNQSEKLLDFESSIESELKAELLTGQQMNLERARAYALQGDMVGVMKELNNQGMTLEKFNNMNVLAQKSYAEALGLSADQLSDQLRKQKIAQEQGKSLAQITEEEALEAEKRQAIQDKFNAAVEKLQDFFGNLIAGPFGQFLEMLTSSLDLITSIGAGLATWYVTSKLIAGTQMLITWYSKQKLIADRLGVGVGNVMVAQLGRMLGLSTAKAVADTTSATALSFGTLLPIILGAGVAIYSLLSSFKTADDMVQPGYGKRTILSPEGSIALNDNDTIVAGTNLGGGGKTEKINSNIDLTPMIAAINQVKASVDKLYAKDTSINMDGKKVGTTLSQGSHKVP